MVFEYYDQTVMFWLHMAFTFGALKTPRLVYSKIIFHRITEETLLVPTVIVLIAKAMYQAREVDREKIHCNVVKFIKFVKNSSFCQI